MLDRVAKEDEALRVLAQAAYLSHTVFPGPVTAPPETAGESGNALVFCYHQSQAAELVEVLRRGPKLDARAVGVFYVPWDRSFPALEAGRRLSAAYEALT